ncbi:MAG TPA: sulfatase [Verrucomicrobiae bacterium]|jgi:arylsulfatase A-like enzyme
MKPNRFVQTLQAIAVAALLTLGLRQPCPAADAKLNVLFIATDDWRPEIACYGAKGMLTPNVDKLAATGVKFDRAYCQFPLCNPSRTSMLNGRFPTTTGVMENTTHFRTAHPDWVTLPEHFKNNGYYAGKTGKIFHGSLEDTKSWTEIADAKMPAGRGIKPAPGAAKKQVKGKQDPAQSDRIVVLDGDGEDHVDYYTALRGIELLEKHQGKPFFIAVGFLKPHSPPTAPKKFFDLFDPAKIELPPDFAPHPTVPPGFPEASVPKRNGDLFINRDASPEAAREMIRAYRASAAWTDWNIGRVLDALVRLDLADQTIVVFFGDHGYHLGEKGKWSKHNSNFEVAARVPLIVRLPGASGNGRACGRTVSFVDVYPTLAELCGLPKPTGLEGHSFSALLWDPSAKWDHPAFTVAKNGGFFGRSVRTERWRYTEWDGGKSGAVLFDHDADPHEMKNLADDAKHAKTLAEMKALLKQLPAAK